VIGLGIEKYFDDSWNVFDFVMIILGIISIMLQDVLTVFKDAKSIKSGRLFKVARV
jgi:hypothetical protein